MLQRCGHLAQAIKLWIDDEAIGIGDRNGKSHLIRIQQHVEFLMVMMMMMTVMMMVMVIMMDGRADGRSDGQTYSGQTIPDQTIPYQTYT